MNILKSIIFAASGQSGFLGNIKFTTENLMESLRVMAIGMGGIFAALLIIYIASVIVQKIFPQKK